MPGDIPHFTEDEVIRIIREHIEGLFPRPCPKCGRVFPTYQDYLLNTTPLGFPVSYNIDANEWKPDYTSGNLSLANCRCGTTLALSSEGMPLKTLWGVLHWIKVEQKHRHLKTPEVLGYLREQVSKQAQSHTDKKHS